MTNMQVGGPFEVPPAVGIEFVVGPACPDLASIIGHGRAYDLLRRHAAAFARENGRELAEGPTRYVRQTGGPVEIWPLVARS